MDNDESMIVEWPFVHIVNHDLLAKCCSHCLKPADKRCAVCNVVTYCDKKCAEADQNQHGQECAAFRQLPYKQKCPLFGMVDDNDNIGEYARLLARFFFKTRADSLPQQGDFYGLVNRTVESLMSHSDNLRKNPSMETHFQAARSLYETVYGKVHNLVVPESEFRELYGKLRINIFSISGEGLASSVDLGLGLYLNMSRFDHSCQEDLLSWFEGPVLKMRPHRMVDVRKPMHELRVTYLEGFQQLNSMYAIPLRRERLDHFKRYYFFDCDCSLCADVELEKEMSYSLVAQCPACQSGVQVANARNTLSCLDCKTTHTSIAAQSLANQARRAVDKVGDVLKITSAITDLDVIRMVVDESITTAEKWLHPQRNVYLLRLYDEYFQAVYYLAINGLALNFIETATCFGEKLIKGYEYYLPEHSAFRAQLCYTLSELYGLLGNIKRREELLWKAMDVWITRSGNEHHCVRELQRLLEQDKDSVCSAMNALSMSVQKSLHE